MAEVKLLSTWVSPFAMRVALALKLKGVEYEDLPQDLSNKSQLLLESNPIYKKIPVLLHNGKVISESAIIVQYVDDLWPEQSPLLPKDPFIRAQHRFWGDFVDKKIWDSIIRFVRATDSQVQEEANKELIESCILFDGALAQLYGDKGPFIGGASMSLLDVMFAPHTVWLKSAAEERGLKFPNPEECPHLHRLFNAVAEHPACREALPTVEKLRVFINTRFKKN